jgi:23S rRNA (cytosine1962-C5)-methyltransferase
VTTDTVRISRKGRRWIDGGHPWIYADDVLAGGAEPGGLVELRDDADRPLGWGLFSAASRIAVRVVTREERRPDRGFWQERIAAAVRRRERAGLLAPRDACRLVSGDAEGVPGLVVDRYADVWVLQSGTAGADRLRELVVDLLAECLGSAPRAVLDRSESAARRLEGLEPRVAWLRGTPVEHVVVEEPGFAYEVDLLAGHKTGHYLDQRANRELAARHARGQSVLDAFSYDGLFALRALQAGAERALCLDTSQPALDRARRNAERNGVADRLETQQADCMRELRERAQRGERHGLVIVDPPAFAKNRQQVEGAERGYRELNRRGLALTAPGGVLCTASCSYNVTPWRFLELLRESAALAGRRTYLEDLRGAPPDHPVLLVLPETWYLKCAFLRVE